VPPPDRGLLTGEQFRTLVAQLIPWFAGIPFLFGMSTFSLVQAFYIAVRSNQFLWAAAKPGTDTSQFAAWRSAMPAIWCSTSRA
jgi:hypothetical protein